MEVIGALSRLKPEDIEAARREAVHQLGEVFKPVAMRAAAKLDQMLNSPNEGIRMRAIEAAAGFFKETRPVVAVQTNVRVQGREGPVLQSHLGLPPGPEPVASFPNEQPEKRLPKVVESEPIETQYTSMELPVPVVK